MAKAYYQTNKKKLIRTNISKEKMALRIEYMSDENKKNRKD